MLADDFKAYVKELQRQLRTGHAGERSYYPALQALLNTLHGRLTVTIEPAGIPGASVDFLVRRGHRTVGYIEAKDIGKSLDEAQESEQLRRYRKRFPNLILTDFLEFRWFIDGELRHTARLGQLAKDKVGLSETGPQRVLALLRDFLQHKAREIARPKALAQRLARLTQELRDLISATFAAEKQIGHLHAQFEAFREVLIHDLSAEQFADMYAQTVTYGLFAARAQNPGQSHFSRKTAVFDLPKTNPFLRQLFGAIAGPELDHEVAWLVDDLADVIGQADFSEILKDFGRRTRKEDPVVHFYETFLAAYDPTAREMRGVYYTPEPVVSYIVRSVDQLLKKRFARTKGLADEKVFILDPACGTGTFLFFVIRRIHEELVRRRQKGAFNVYVGANLLRRLFGFELLMAPYAVAHMKLGIQLKDLGYKFPSDQRLGVYLTNTLEEAVTQSEVVFAQWIADEANAAAEIKRDKPIMVVLGNPPYSGVSANRGEWITALLKQYYEVDGKPLGEKKVWLQDDYVKFIRFGQWRIEQTGEGILAFVTNHAYLDNPTFRGMRQGLMHAFDDIYILDLHGNYRKKETCPDGSKDGNVFDIQQGVAIGIFVKDGSREGEPARVHHADIWGLREAKQNALFDKDISSTDWAELQSDSPWYFFVPYDTAGFADYEKGWKVTDIFQENVTGIVTARDKFVIDLNHAALRERIQYFRNSKDSDERVKSRLALSENYAWRVSAARRELKKVNNWEQLFRKVSYRPFDKRWIYYHPSVVWRPRTAVMRHMLAGANLAIATTRSIEIGRGYEHVFCSRNLIQHHTVSLKEVNYLFPLYLYPERGKGTKKQEEMDHGPTWPPGRGGRVPNLAPKFVEALADKLRLEFVTDGCGDLKKTFGPEDVFHYAYAVFHSPTYRERYAEFLKIDFPRLPLTSSKTLFRKLCALGAELVALHLLESPKLDNFLTSYPVDGDHLVAKGHPKYQKPEEVAQLTDGESKQGRVYVNKEQFFEGVPPEVWQFHIGGYQVCEKWLKDRRGRNLTIDDINHYQKVVVALSETIRLMAEIDAAIPSWPLP